MELFPVYPDSAHKKNGLEWILPEETSSTFQIPERYASGFCFIFMIFLLK